VSNSDGRIRPEEIARVVVRPLGSVPPLGFLVFGVGSFVTAAYGLGPGETSTTLGVFLLADGVVILILAIAAIFGNPPFTVLLGVACARVALNGVYELTGTKTVEHASRFVGLVTAVSPSCSRTGSTGRSCRCSGTARRPRRSMPTCWTACGGSKASRACAGVSDVSAVSAAEDVMTWCFCRFSAH
jgi:hypothetical protein